MQHPKLVHPRLTTHPLTGAAIVPVGYRKDGRPIMPIMGGAEPDDKKDPPKPDPDKPAGPKPDDKKDPDKPDPDDKGAGGKDALKADLARERDKRQELEQSVAALKKSQDEQRDAFAKALGLAPEETSDTDKLSEQLSKLQDRLDGADRRTQVLEVATEHGIGKDDLHMLTGSTAEELKKQAEWIQGKNTEAEKAKGKPKADPSQGGGGKPATGGDSDQIQASMERSLGRRPQPQNQ